ncbi:ubinuclein-1-like isoform X1 [Ananas comosus]|uniref:Ubinuclein-1-like isoform X1 n=1 Tax=Ananas comosus TaxID=4615 RepID=A0A6P5F9F0_ANACO|nr:ubinuclein-1-like isoform X1 [Ananas comosus]
MEEDKVPAARVSPAHSTIPPPTEPSSSSNPPERERAAARAAAAAAAEEEEGGELRFEVELRPGETTIVSWKKLLKEAGYGGGPPQPRGADPVLAAQPGPSGSVKPAEDDLTEKEPPTNRFSAVIEKIERLYMGKHSSDEEDLDDAPVDDQYDTEDSFIDDAELDEYFQVDKLVTKHNGYFVNKGKLEQIEPSSSPVVASRKRRRKDSTHHEDQDHVPSEHVRIRRKRMNTVARNELYMRKNLPSYGEEDSKLIDNKQSAPTAVYKKKSVDLASSMENPTNAKLQNKDVGALQSRDISEKSRGTNESYNHMYSDHPDKGVSCFLDFQSRKLLNGENDGAETKFQCKEKSTSGEFAHRNISGSSYPLQAVQSTTRRVREGAAIRPKGTRLERAIRDLEKIVAAIRPPSFDVQDADPAYQGVKRRLPPEVKQTLAKVARLSASKGKISEDELIDRLMGIVGHLVHRKTLKRNMRELVELGLSAKQQKADRFEQIKREVYEMIKARISTMKSKGTEQQDGSTDDFQEAVSNEERRALKGRHSMDAALEDKICDLYDLYVEGMDEDKGPLSRKLYVELAELWPHGYMDNVGIKDAIYRSKERKGALYRQHKVRDEERLKRRRLAAAAKLANSAQTAQVRTLQERPVITYTSQGIVSPEKTNTSNQPLTSTSKVTNPTLPLVDQGSKYEGGNRNVDASKKPKRNPEHELGEAQALSLKLPPQQQHVKERQKSQKNTDEPNASGQPKASSQMPCLPNSDQPS